MWTTWKVGQRLDYAHVGWQKQACGQHVITQQVLSFCSFFWLLTLQHKAINPQPPEQTYYSKAHVCLRTCLQQPGENGETLHVHQAECRADELFYRMPVIHFIPMADRVIQHLCKSQGDREDVLKADRFQTISLVSFGMGFHSNKFFFQEGWWNDSLHIWFHNVRMSVSKLRSIAAWASVSRVYRWTRKSTGIQCIQVPTGSAKHLMSFTCFKSGCLSSPSNWLLPVWYIHFVFDCLQFC